MLFDILYYEISFGKNVERDCYVEEILDIFFSLLSEIIKLEEQKIKFLCHFTYA